MNKNSIIMQRLGTIMLGLFILAGTYQLQANDGGLNCELNVPAFLAADNSVFPPNLEAGKPVEGEILTPGKGVSSFTPLFENFNNGIPADWVIELGPTATSSSNWENVTNFEGNSLDGTPFMIILADDGVDGILNSPIIDASGTDGLYLEFDQYYRKYWGTAEVEVFDGTNWLVVLHLSANIGSWAAPNHQVIDVTEYANAAFQVRFHYWEAGNYWWAVDNVSIASYTQISATVITNSGDSPAETDILFTNTSEPDLGLTYETTLDESGYFSWDEFRTGTYDIHVEKSGFAPISITGYEIDGPEDFVWVLEEQLDIPANLYVTPTGLATCGEIFTSVFENFNDGLPADWAVGYGPNATSSDNWANVTDDEGQSLNGTPFMIIYGAPEVDGILYTPVIDYSTTDALYLEFDQFYNSYWGTADVEVYDGTNWVRVLHQTFGNAGSWTEPDHQVIDVSDYANAAFQARFHYWGAVTYYWAVDNVSVTNTATSSRSLQTYNVFHDGVFVANVTEPAYQFGTNGEYLVDGQTYLAEVSAVYTTGESNKASYTWTYIACSNYPNPENLSVVQLDGSSDISLTWSTPAIPPDYGQVAFARIYRDGEVLAEATEGSYLDEEVDYGTHTYCITFVYESGAESCPATVCETVEVVGGVVNGNVKQAAYLGGANIEGAEVMLTNTSDNTITYTFITDADGNYSGEVPAAYYNYEVSADGYESASLEGVYVPQANTVTINFELLEFPYPVIEVTAEELSGDVAQVSWYSGGGSSSWLYYDNGANEGAFDMSVPFSWGIKFDPDQLTPYAGTSLTKLLLVTADINTIQIFEGPNAQTLIYEQEFTDTSTDLWTEIELTTPVPIDVTKELWITLYHATGNEAVYPAGVGYGMGEPNGDLFSTDGITWVHLLDVFGWDNTWNLRGFVTDMVTNTTVELGEVHNSAAYKSHSEMDFRYKENTTSNTAVDVNVHQDNRALAGYNVYRTTCSTSELQFLGFTTDEQFTDDTWGVAGAGIYKWGVVAVYDQNSSEISFSNCLENDMFTHVSVTATTNSGDSPAETNVLFTNTSEPGLGLTYETTLDGTGYFSWDEFRKGTYDIDVEKSGFAPVLATGYEIDSPEDFVWVLEEQIGIPSNFYVTPTGFATWGDPEVGSSFTPVFENFNNGVPEGWVIEAGPTSLCDLNWENITGYQGNSIDDTPFMMINADICSSDMDGILNSSVIDASGTDVLYLEFDQYYQDFFGTADVEVFDGTSWVLVLHQAGASVGSWTEPDHQVIDVTSYANAAFQVRFHFWGAWMFGWAIDNVLITNAATSVPRSLQTYKVFNDGVLVAEVTEKAYQYGTNGEVLVNGQTYLSEVSAVYTTGESDKASYTWTYIACDNYAAPTNFTATQVGMSSVAINWTTPSIPPADDQIAFARIYRDGEVLAEVTDGSYMDESVIIGTYTYCITFVYESGAETCPATVCETVEVVGSGMVNGNVIQVAYLGGANIEGAEVMLTNTADNTITYTFTTDANGNYSGEVPAGYYDYEVSADGYLSSSLEDVYVALTNTVTLNFKLLEYPYPVGDVTVEELSGDAVQVSWGAGGSTVSDWLYYDNGANEGSFDMFVPFNWAIKFDPAQLTPYAGTSLTRLLLVTAGTNTIQIFEGSNAQTLIYEQEFTDTSTDLWTEIELTTPVPIDITKELWITIHNVGNQQTYPAGLGWGMGEPNGDLFTTDGITWVHLLDAFGWDNTWNLRGFVTDMVTNKTVEFGEVHNSAAYKSQAEVNFQVKENTTSNTAVVVNTHQDNRALTGFNVYRTTCATGELQFLGFTTDEQFTDDTWGVAESGVYKWGVVAVYDQNSSEISFSNCLVKKSQPWPFTVTGLAHTIQIPASVDPDIFGEELQTGDWVGVFYTDDNGNEICGGAKQMNPFGVLTITAYGDDITTSGKDGFADGETFKWKMFDTSEGMEYYATAVYDETMPNKGGFADLGLSKLVELHAAFGQFYSFSQGWNSISSYIVPNDPDVENMFSLISDELIIMRNLTNVYWPGENVNSIGDFDNESGYAIKVTDDLQFNIQGEANASPTVTLAAGWHYLPVLSECPAVITDVFGESIDDVIIIQDLIGTGVYWPDMDIYTLEDLQPGLAYKIKLANEITFTFPECVLKSSPVVTQQTNKLSTPWGEIKMTPSSQIVAILQPAMKQLQQGDAIGIFDDNGTPFGYLDIDVPHQNQALVIFGNDPSSSNKDGFASGDQTYFRLLRVSTGEEFSLEVEYDNTMDNNTGRYQPGSLAAITKIEMKSIETGLTQNNLEIYPNPAHDELSIKINNMESGLVSLSIFDSRGQKIIDKTFSNKIDLNVSTFSGGVYYLKLQTSEINEVRKIVIK